MSGNTNLFAHIAFSIGHVWFFPFGVNRCELYNFALCNTKLTNKHIILLRL